MAPPRKPISADSVTNSRTIRARLPPIARLMPISRVRSAIDIAIVFTTERPPTSEADQGDPDEDRVQDRRRAPDLLVEVLAGHRRDAGDLGLDPRRRAPRRPRPASGRRPSRSRCRTRSSVPAIIGGSVLTNSCWAAASGIGRRLVGRGQRRRQDADDGERHALERRSCHRRACRTCGRCRSRGPSRTSPRRPPSGPALGVAELRTSRGPRRTRGRPR